MAPNFKPRVLDMQSMEIKQARRQPDSAVKVSITSARQLFDEERQAKPIEIVPGAHQSFWMTFSPNKRMEAKISSWPKPGVQSKRGSM